MEQPPKKAQYGGVSVCSSLSLNLSSQHHSKRVICQAYSPVLAEGANTFFKLNVLCKWGLNCLFISSFIGLFVSFFLLGKGLKDVVCINPKRCIMMIHDGADVSYFCTEMSAHSMCMCAFFVYWKPLL